MKKASFSLLSGIFAVLLATACGGGGGGGDNPPAPKTSVDLPRTGQTTSFAAGDDGVLQKGVAWPDPRFTANTDTSVTDELTGLAWAPNGKLMVIRDADWDQDDLANDGKVTWQHALDYVAKLNAENYLGHADWRLPNIDELRSLMNYEQSNIAAWLNTQGFTNVGGDNYWSSTTDAMDPTVARALNMVFGTKNGGSKTTGFRHVWPVRDAGIPSTLSLPRTGQTTSFAAGDDGDLQKGVAWPAARFGINADTTVTDKLTGLIWAPDGNFQPARDAGWDHDGTVDDGQITWQHALDYVAKLNAESYLGHADWRLPNVNELESLVHDDYAHETTCGGSCSTNAAWLNTQGFANAQAGYYWSSTTYASNTANVLEASLAWGYVIPASKTAAYHYVWPVRGGN